MNLIGGSEVLGSAPLLRVGSFNANGLGDRSKRREVLNWIHRKQDDIILLQETHSVPETEHNWLQDWEGTSILFNHGASNARGTAVLIRGTEVTVDRHSTLVEGRSSLLEITYQGTKYCIVNVYAPNNDDTSFLETVFQDSSGRQRNDFVVFAGDWNTILNNTLDKSGGQPYHSNRRCQTLLNNIVNDLGLHDVYRLKNQDAKTFTHYNKRCKTGTRLDFFLVDTCTVNLPTCTSEISHGFRSDHSYVSLTLQGNTLLRGKGYWKLNNSHLADDTFCDAIKTIIDDTQNQDYDSYGGLWDVIKFKVKDYCIRHGIRKKKEHVKDKADLESQLNSIKSEISNLNSDNNLRLNELYSELNTVQEKLNSIHSSEIQGIITRAKAQWVEEGERSTRYFLGLEKFKQQKKSISKLRNDQGEFIMEQDSISRHVVDFYQGLFSSRRPNHRTISEYLNNSNLDTIDEDQASDLDSQITIEELDAIVEGLKNGKSPGYDGLTAEFYKKFWGSIRNIIYNVFLEAIEAKSLPPSLRVGIITLLPKPKSVEELHHIANWRPITLLNNDYKILTHLIKKRLLNVIPQIISNCQSGFQAGRSTTDNLVLMYLVLEHFSNNPQDEGFLLQVDFEKAFDSVEHAFLFQTLVKLGFGNYLINLVKLVFHGCFSYAIVNGHLTSPIYLGRGLHQGSPLSPILFLIVAQVFTNNLHNNSSISGLDINSCSLLMSLFADDTDMFLSASKETIDAVFYELKQFGQCAGCMYNAKKTKCIPLGATAHNTALLEEVKRTYGQNFIPPDSKFSALGINFCASTDLKRLVMTVYEQKLSRISMLIRSWNKRHLTVFGKVTLIKTLLLAQLVYLTVPLPRPSDNILKTIDTTMFNFLWGGKRDKIKRDITIKSKDLGGLDMINFKSFIVALKVKLIYKLADHNFHHPWKTIVLDQLKYRHHLAISIDCGEARRPEYIFTQDLLNCFQYWRTASSTASNLTPDLCIWSNKAITDIGRPLWNARLIQKRFTRFLTSWTKMEGY